MSATSSCRLRKVSCPDCGYTIRMARSWMAQGLPVCPCGTALEPVELADQAFAGMIGPDDVPGPEWTRICRENGWDGAINRKGAAQLAHIRRTGGHALYAERERAAHCAYAGCGRWVAAGADFCSAGHAQHEHVVAEAAAF